MVCFVLLDLLFWVVGYGLVLVISRLCAVPTGFCVGVWYCHLLCCGLAGLDLNSGYLLSLVFGCYCLGNDLNLFVVDFA